MCPKVVKTALFIVKKVFIILVLWTRNCEEDDLSHEHEYKLRFDWPQYYLSSIELSQKCANTGINFS